MLHLLCECSIAGASLPDDVVAYMAAHNMVHEAEHNDCFHSSVCELGNADICEIASLLRKWDIRTAFASAA